MNHRRILILLFVGILTAAILLPAQEEDSEDFRARLQSLQEQTSELQQQVSSLQERTSWLEGEIDKMRELLQTRPCPIPTQPQPPEGAEGFGETNGVRHFMLPLNRERK